MSVDQCGQFHRVEGSEFMSVDEHGQFHRV